MASRKLTVQIVGDSRDLERAFARSTRSAENFSSRTSRALGGLARGAAFAGIGAAATGLAVSLKVGFDELIESQKVLAQTNAVLKSTGGAAGVTAKQVDALATSLSRMSGVDDEAIAASENVLLTFTKISSKGDIFKDATKSALDMSVALGTDLQSASIQVGKALNDPIKGVTALRRVGVSFTADQIKQIKTLVATGRQMEAQKLILRELNTEFGGSAEAAGNTLAGALNKAQNAFSNIAGTIVGLAAPALQKYAEQITKYIEKAQASGELQRKVNEFMRKAGEVARGLRDGLKLVNDIAGPLIKTVGGLETAVKLLVAAMVVSKVTRFASALSLVGTAGGKGKGGKGGGKGGLGVLGLLGAAPGPAKVAVAVAVTAYVVNKNKKTIDTAVDKWLKGHGVWFGTLGGSALKIPVGFDMKKFDPAWLAKMTELRAVLAKVNGEGDTQVRVLDILIDRYNKLGDAANAAAIGIGQVGKGSLPEAGSHLRPDTADADVPVTPRRKGATADQRNAWWDAMIGRRIDRTQDLASLRDQIAALKNIAGAIAARIATTKDITRKLNLEDKLLDVRRQTKGLQEQLLEGIKQQADDVKDKAKEAADKIKKAAKDTAAKLKAAAEEAARALADARDNVRDTIGSIFEGPILDSRQAQFAADFGVLPDAKQFAANLAAQLAQFKQFQAALAQIKKRGGSAQLVDELRAGGVSQLGLVKSIAGADKSTFAQITKTFGRREAAVAATARMDVKARAVQVQTQTVTVNGNTGGKNDFGAAAKFGRTANSGRRG